ncbi:MAG: hypothetical protein EZS28_020274 [Streblomastix strix]|uniref:Uncharacterized protein n=1 Tax=Streblomastix strix TaxID=222440 RepID=A0A5J4VNS3_9EUKA|nr:MAG: hypothetical protein EZS28_020274 [Streblomastix strix]
MNMWSSEHLNCDDRDIGLILTSVIQPRLQGNQFAPALRQSEDVIQKLTQTNSCATDIYIPESLQSYFTGDYTQMKDNTNFQNLKRCLNFI